MTSIERLAPIEVAAGIALGLDPAAPRVRPGADFREALEAAILPALRRPPCIVSFSGGRDSSTVLAVATALARREGLPEPVPATNRFPAVPLSDETSWQEQVVDHVGSGDWIRLSWTDELDLVGPYARGLLARHGLLWPFNLHFHAPLLEAARGGSLLTGVGGDELFGGTGWRRASRVLSGAVRPRPRDVLRVGFALAPRFAKRRVFRRRLEHPFDWLHPAVREQVLRTLAGEAATEPVRAARRGAWLRRQRYLRLGVDHFRTMADDYDVLVVHPLWDPRVVETAVTAPELRHATRTAGMRSLFAADLPQGLLERTTKSSFDGAFWTHRARTFAQAWDGAGFDDGIVDAEELRREWASETPDGRTFLLLQTLALDEARRGQPSEAISATA